jgi:hypothetical protein
MTQPSSGGDAQPGEHRTPADFAAAPRQVLDEQLLGLILAEPEREREGVAAPSPPDARCRFYGTLQSAAFGRAMASRHSGKQELLAIASWPPPGATPELANR